MNRRVLSGCTERADGQYGTTCPSQRNRDTLSKAGESAWRAALKSALSTHTRCSFLRRARDDTEFNDGRLPLLPRSSLNGAIFVETRETVWISSADGLSRRIKVCVVPGSARARVRLCVCVCVCVGNVKIAKRLSASRR